MSWRALELERDRGSCASVACRTVRSKEYPVKPLGGRGRAAGRLGGRARGDPPRRQTAASGGGVSRTPHQRSRSSGGPRWRRAAGRSPSSSRPRRSQKSRREIRRVVSDRPRARAQSDGIGLAIGQHAARGSGARSIREASRIARASRATRCAPRLLRQTEKPDLVAEYSIRLAPLLSVVSTTIS
jgi:hypothetical protein